ncbi:zinc-dependent alcohol dehydrogenase [Halalkalibacter oceani]|uniref:zinc-dependent alcohol dehydrogenase n=1 Tax=Halalkalibacter oceani TaxID=1653776 RepID=UPI00339A0069
MKSIMKTERVYGGIQVVEVEPPVLKADEVLVEIHHASICGSDIHAYQFAPTHHYIQTPVIMGHEAAGRVAEIGSAVTNFDKGDRVVIEAILYCGKCENCLQGKTHLCDDFQVRGMVKDGVFTELVAVSTKYLHKIPSSLSYERACLAEPLAVASHAVLDQSRVRAGDVVLVTGPGPIGLLVAQMVKAVGAEPIVVGIESDEQVRLPVARELGCKTINVSLQSIPEVLKAWHGKETVSHVIECSGAASVFQACLAVTAKGGSITLVGLFSKMVEGDLTSAIRKEISIFSSCAYDWMNMERAIKLLAQNKMKTEGLVSYYKPEEAINAFEDAIAKKVSKPVFVFKQ